MSAVDTGTGTPSARGLHGLVTAEGISMLGTRMSTLAVPWFVLTSTGSAAATGLVAFLETLPLVLAQALGGPAVDRLGPRRVSVATDLLSAVAFGAVPVLHLLGRLDLVTLGVLVAVCGSARGLGTTARSVLVPAVTRAAGAPLERGAGLHDGVNRLGTLLGAPLAGVLIALWSGPAVLLLDAGTFVASAVLVLAVVPQPRREAAPPAADLEPADSYLGQLRAGLAFLVRDRLLLAIGLMVLVTNLLDQAYSAVLSPAWVAQVTGSSVTLGLLSGVFGGGAVLGNVLLTWLGPRLPRRRTFAWSFLVAGAPQYLVMAVTASISPVLAVALVRGVGAGSLNPILGAVEYERIPPALQARVLGAVSALAWAGIPLGALVAGVAVEHGGLRPTFVVAGAVYLLVTLAPFVFPAWRGMERGSGQREDTPAEPVG